MSTTLVETSTGAVRGRVADNAVVFSSIPYAAPPIGNLRLRPPQPHPGWRKERDCRAPPPAPPQAASPIGESAGQPETSEDCLFVSVYTPGCDSERRPVLFWVHGGGLTFGWGASPTYDGSLYAARHGVVVVSVGYRLGLLANLAHPLLDEGTGTGSLSLLDQIQALRWVRDNIERFGGDPARVTVFGESAGGMSVGALLAAPAARKLVTRGIVQSGGANARSLEEAAEYAERFSAFAGVELNYGDLQRLPLERYMAAQEALNPLAFMSRGLGLTIDGQRVRQMPVNAIAAGAVAERELISGTTADEARVALMMADLSGVEAMDRGRAVRRIGRLLEAREIDATRAEPTFVAMESALSSQGLDTRPFAVLYAVDTELNYRSYSLDLLEAQHGAGGSGFGYLFDWSIRARGGLLGSPHAIDVPFSFGQFGDMVRTGTLQDHDRAVAERMMSAWAAFAATGDPSVDGLPWESWEPQARNTMRIGLEPGVVGDPAGEQRGVVTQLLDDLG